MATRKQRKLKLELISPAGLGDQRQVPALWDLELALPTYSP